MDVLNEREDQPAPEHLRRFLRARAILAGLAIFATGVVAGAAADRAMFHEELAAPRVTTPEASAPPLDHLQKARQIQADLNAGKTVHINRGLFMIVDNQAKETPGTRSPRIFFDLGDHYFGYIKTDKGEVVEVRTFNNLAGEAYPGKPVNSAKDVSSPPTSPGSLWLNKTSCGVLVQFWPDNSNDSWDIENCGALRDADVNAVPNVTLDNTNNETARLGRTR
jgi:hypothetical protein